MSCFYKLLPYKSVLVWQEMVSLRFVHRSKYIDYKTLPEKTPPFIISSTIVPLLTILKYTWIHAAPDAVKDLALGTKRTKEKPLKMEMVLSDLIQTQLSPPLCFTDELQLLGWDTHIQTLPKPHGLWI